MKLSEMQDAEKQALAALVRVMVGVDGEYSAAEMADLAKTAEYLGDDEFWELINDVVHQHLDQEVLEERARAVERSEAREAIYGILFGVAAAGTVEGEEGKLLDWLAETWELETSVETEASIEGASMAEYVKVAKTSEIEDQSGKCVEVNGHPIAIFNVKGEFYAIDDLCPHEEGPLSEGFVDGLEVECPWHAACFNLKTGKASGPPAEEDVKTYPVRVVDGEVEIEV